MPKISVRIFSLLVGLVFVHQVACKPYLPPVVHDVIDCVAADQGKLSDLALELAPLVIAGDWSAIKARAISAGPTIGGCVLAVLVQRYLAPPAGTSVPPPDLSIAAKQALETFRNEQAGNATYRTAIGDL